MGDAKLFYRENVTESKLTAKLRAERWRIIQGSNPPTYENGSGVYMIPVKVSLGLWTLNYYKGKCPCERGN
jgi:hypothetical protein